MASLNGQTIASSYEQLLHTDTDGGGNGNTLVTIKDGDNGTIFGLKLATNKVEVIPSAADDANAFEVSKNNGTAVFTVNTSTPGATLVSDEENILRLDGLQGNIDFRYGSDIEFDRAGQVYITANNGSGELNFRTGGQNTRMHIDSSGSVGIGTDSFSSFNSNADNLVIHETGDFTGITLSADNDQGSNIYFADPQDDNVGGITYNHSSNFMNFRVNGAERIRILSDGRVAIKATSLPQDFGGERGHLLISSTDNAGANNYGVLQLQGHSIANDAAIGGIYFYDHSNSNAIIQAARSSDTDDARLAFYTSNSGGSPNKHMTIEASGRMFYQAGSNFKTGSIGSVDRLGMIDFYDDAGYNPVLHVMSDREDPDFSPLRLTGGHNNPSSASQCIWIDFHDGDGTHRGGIQNGSTPDNPEFFNGGSDERIKTNIVDTATNGLQIINGLELKDFTVQEWYNGYSTDVTCDFVAQNAEEHFPAMVSEHKMKPKREEFRQDFVDAGLEAVEVETALGTEEMFPVKCISHGALIPILVKALQEADDKIDALTARIEALEA